MRESKIEEAVWRYAKTKGYDHYKFSSPARAAVPDRIFITPYGFLFFIEFKATGAKPTPAQEREHEKLRRMGQKVYVVDDTAEGKAIIDQHATPWWTQ